MGARLTENTRLDRASVHDYTYIRMCKDILASGARQHNRTGIDSISMFGNIYRYDLRDGFPLLTTKKVNFEATKAELFGFLKGAVTLEEFPEPARKFWEPWAKEDGYLGPIYGAQWIDWNCDLKDYPYPQMNQLQDIIDRLKKDPTDRRCVVSAWNYQYLSKMCLPPCHVMFQLKGYPPYLDLMMFQRSMDAPLGAPHNIASYALLLTMIAQEVGLQPRCFIHAVGDAHIYVNQEEGIRKQIRRIPRPAPEIRVTNKPFWELKESDVELLNYDPHPFIKFEVAV